MKRFGILMYAFCAITLLCVYCTEVDFSIHDSIDWYEVIYDGNSSNGGTAPIGDSRSHFKGSKVTVLGKGSLTKQGFHFNGWNTATDGSGTAYAPGSAFNATADITLYAMWEACTYTEENITTAATCIFEGAGHYSCSKCGVTGGGVFTIEATCLEMVRVEGGAFTMGCVEEPNDACDFDEIPRRITVSSFSIGKYEVTQALWKLVMADHPTPDLRNPSFFRGDDLPVERISWNDVVNEFIPRLNRMTGPGRIYRLPTEAEWEYAARGGNRSQTYKYSGSNILDDVAWYRSNSAGSTKPVGTKGKNELGIYDMSGNVWELVSDWYAAYNIHSNTDPKGPSSGSMRVIRGGSWDSDTELGHCRVSFRGLIDPDDGFPNNHDVGFRLVLDSPP